jgi:hypothetical protein
MTMKNDRFTPLDRLFQEPRGIRIIDEDDYDDDSTEEDLEQELSIWGEEDFAAPQSWKDEIGYDPRESHDDDWD